jgi:hypothetical protein
MTITDLFSKSTQRRLWPALITVLLPLAIAAGVFWLTVESLINDIQWKDILSPFDSDKADFKVLDMAGRIQFGIVSALLRTAAAGVVALVIFDFWTRVGATAAIMLSAVLAIIFISLYVLGVHAAGDHGMIRLVIEKGYGAKKPEIDDAILLNVAFSVAGGIGMLIGFAAVAFRARSDDYDVASLQGRKRALERTTIAGAVLLVFLTTLNKTLVDWPRSLVAEKLQDAYASLATAIGSYWGTLSTLAIAFALIPAFISLRFDIDNAARAQASRDEDTVKSWKIKNNLEFSMKSGVAAAVAAVAPTLAVPGLNLASKLFH